MKTHIDARRIDSESALDLDRLLREALHDPYLTTDVRLGGVAFALDAGQVIGIIDAVVGIAGIAHALWQARREHREAVQQIAERAVPKQPQISTPNVDVPPGTGGSVRVSVVVEAQWGTTVDVTVQVRSQSIRVNVTPLR